jgi:hypothetical protein
MYQISNELSVNREKKKLGNSVIRDIFLCHSIGKDQWIETKLKLDMYLGIAKQCTKYQMNICKQRKTDNS